MWERDVVNLEGEVGMGRVVGRSFCWNGDKFLFVVSFLGGALGVLTRSFLFVVY